MRYYDVNIYSLGDEYKIIYIPRGFNPDSKRYYSGYDAESQLMIGDRFACSVSRSRSAVLGLALCNEWQYFITSTLDPRKYDRYNLNKWQCDFSQWIRNQRRTQGHDFKYLLIPEAHQDGAWHMHGIVSGVPWEYLQKFNFQEHPSDLAKKGYRFHSGMLQKFGYNSFGKIKNQAAVSRYILKYIAKGLGENDISRGSNLYYCSHGLKRPELVCQANSTALLTDVSFENEFCAISYVKQNELDLIEPFLI